MNILDRIKKRYLPYRTVEAEVTSPVTVTGICYSGFNDNLEVSKIMPICMHKNDTLNIEWNLELEYKKGKKGKKVFISCDGELLAELSRGDKYASKKTLHIEYAGTPDGGASYFRPRKI